MIDLDHCKSVNDTYDHLNGDAVLKEAAARIARTMRLLTSCVTAVKNSLPCFQTARSRTYRTWQIRTRIAIAEKPIPTSAGAETIARLCGMEQEVREEPAASGLGGSSSIWDPAAALERFERDEELLCELCRYF